MKEVYGRYSSTVSLIQNGTKIVASESWSIEGKPYHKDEVEIPLEQAVHILLNMTPGERALFGTERRMPPPKADLEDDGA